MSNPDSKALLLVPSDATLRMARILGCRWVPNPKWTARAQPSGDAP